MRGVVGAIDGIGWRVGPTDVNVKPHVDMRETRYSIYTPHDDATPRDASRDDIYGHVYGV
jgi:hypothetical protein